MEEKLARVRGYLREKGYTGAVFARQDNFNWITGGGNSRVIVPRDAGHAAVVVTEEQVFLVAQWMDGPRIMDEEMAHLAAEPVFLHWYEASVPARAVELAGARPVCDLPGIGGEERLSELYDLHFPLTDEEYRTLRHVLRETDEMENRKVICALEHGFVPLLCIGETAEEKAQGIADEVLRVQLKVGLRGVTAAQTGQLRVAYEPVWAIGVGGTPATKEYAAARHAGIRACLTELFDAAAQEIPLLYGGSVNPDNAEGLIGMPEIDGLFVGRSAWDAARFAAMVEAVLPVWRAKAV